MKSLLGIILMFSVLIAVESNAQNNSKPGFNLSKSVQKLIIKTAKGDKYLGVFHHDTDSTTVYFTNDGLLVELMKKNILSVEKISQSEYEKLSKHESSEVNKMDVELIERLTSNFNFWGGVSIPSGEFSSTSSDGAGFAVTGYSLGIDFNLPIIKEIALISTAALSVNAFDKSSLNKIFQKNGFILNENVDDYNTCWGLTGLNYEKNISQLNTLNFSLQIGFLFPIYPKLRVYYKGNQMNQSTTANLTFAYAINFGIKFNKVNLGARLYYSNPESNQLAASGYTSLNVKVKLPVEIIQISLGITI